MPISRLSNALTAFDFHSISTRTHHLLLVEVFVELKFQLLRDGVRRPLRLLRATSRTLATVVDLDGETLFVLSRLRLARLHLLPLATVLGRRRLRPRRPVRGVGQRLGGRWRWRRPLQADGRQLGKVVDRQGRAVGYVVRHDWGKERARATRASRRTMLPVKVSVRTADMRPAAQQVFNAKQQTSPQRSVKARVEVVHYTYTTGLLALRAKQ